MPKDYFEVVEEPEEVVSESERQAKVIEFVYQVQSVYRLQGGPLFVYFLTDLPLLPPGDEKNL